MQKLDNDIESGGLHETFEGFSSQPNERVWGGLESFLVKDNARKRKNRIIFRLAASFALILTIGFGSLVWISKHSANENTYPYHAQQKNPKDKPLSDRDNKVKSGDRRKTDDTSHITRSGHHLAKTNTANNSSVATNNKTKNTTAIPRRDGRIQAQSSIGSLNATEGSKKQNFQKKEETNHLLAANSLPIREIKSNTETHNIELVQKEMPRPAFKNRFSASASTRIFSVNNQIAFKALPILTTEVIQDEIYIRGRPSHFSSPEFTRPIEYSLGLNYDLNRRISLTGHLGYLNIKSHSKTEVYKENQTFLTSNIYNYSVGLQINYKVVDKTRFNLYALAGFSGYYMDRTTLNYRHYENGDLTGVHDETEKVGQLRSSLDIGAGGSFRFGKRLELFAEKEFNTHYSNFVNRYNPNYSNDVNSSVEIGLRYNL